MITQIRFVFCLLTLFGFNAYQAQIKTIPYQALPTAAGGTVGSTMFLGASMSTSTITITFTGPSDRYIALGLGSFMSPADALIYTVGKPGSFHALGWNDYYVSASNISGVNNDANQNWTILSNNVASGQRTVVASRALNTGDANDVALTFSSTALNVVWARNATSDYTIAYHGNNNRAFSIVLPWLSQPAPAFTSSTNICQGTTVSYSNTSTGGLNTYTWNFEGGNPATSTATNPVVTYSVPGTYSVSLIATNPIGTGTVVQTNYIVVNPTQTPSISITAASTSVCAGAVFNASATVVNGGASPVYQWKINGVNAGSNSPTFSTTALSNNATITCVLVSNATCANPATVTSVNLPVVVSSTAAAAVSVAISAGNNPMCVGGSLSFSASASNGGNAPAYQWQVNSVNAGGNSPSFSLVPSNGNVVRCIVTSNAICASVLSATSSVITLTVSSVLVPSVSVLQTSGTNPACVGQLLSFSATPANGGNNPAYTWFVSGVPAGSNSAVFSSSTLVNGAVITCSMTSNSQCANPNSAIGNSISLVVNPVPPQPVISPSGSVSLCAGSSLTLSSSATNGNTWSTGATSPTLLVTSAGTYTVQNTLNGCSSPPSNPVQVTVLSLPTVGMASVTPLCVNDDTISLQGSPAGGVYSGTGVNGSAFSPQLSGAGTTTLIYTYTASNNCSNTASVSVLVSACTGLSDLSAKPTLAFVYPNPSKGEFILQFEYSKIDRLDLRDIHGKLLLHEENLMQDVYRLDLKHYSGQVFFLYLQSGKDQQVQKLLKSE